jgi:hypothetical protein
MSNVNISAIHSVINANVAAKNIRFLTFGVNAKIERKNIIENRSILIVLCIARGHNGTRNVNAKEKTNNRILFTVKSDFERFLFNIILFFADKYKMFM